MEGGNTFPFYVRIDVETNFNCLSPFIPAGAITSPFSIDLGSTTTTMALTSYTWTNDVSCGAIAVVFSITSTTLQLS